LLWFSILFGDWLIADKDGRSDTWGIEGKNMLRLKTEIAVYLCGIMLVLGLIIIAGVARQYLAKKK
jgi:hypothetical protein